MNQAEVTLPVDLERYKQAYEQPVWRLLGQAVPAYLNLILRNRQTEKEAIIGALEAGTRLPEHVEEGLRFAENMKRADRAVNEFYYQVANDEESVFGKQLKEKMEDPENSDHGYPHLRRVEEWFEAVLLNTPDIRHSSWLYRFWLPSLYLANRFHDSIQLLSGKKDSHAELAELWLLSQKVKLAKAFDVSEEEADLYLRGAAAIIHHHSHPESLQGKTKKLAAVSPQGLYQKHIGDANFLLENIRKEYLDAVSSQQGEQGTITGPLDPQSLVVLRRYAQIFGFADKADSAFPGDYATIRSFMSKISHKRKIFEGINEGEDPRAYVERVLNIKDPKYSFQSDIERRVFELGREIPTAGSYWLQKKMQKNSVAAVVAASGVYLGLMEGKTEPITSIYNRRREDLLYKTARREKLPRRLVREIQEAGLIEAKERILIEFLKNRKRTQENDNRLAQTISAIKREQAECELALKGKTGGYSGQDVEFVRQVFAELEKILREDFFYGDEPVKQFLPYKYFDSIANPNEMQRGEYRKKKRGIEEKERQ